MGDGSVSRDVLLGERVSQAQEAITQVKQRWQWLLDHLDLPLATAEAQFAQWGIEAQPLQNRAQNLACFIVYKIIRCECHGKQN